MGKNLNLALIQNLKLNKIKGSDVLEVHEVYIGHSEDWGSKVRTSPQYVTYLSVPAKMRWKDMQQFSIEDAWQTRFSGLIAGGYQEWLEGKDEKDELIEEIRELLQTLSR